MKLSQLLFLVLILSCNSDDGPMINIELPFNFEDGFESANNDLDDLIQSDGSRWSNFQIVSPINGENVLELNSSTVNQGNHSLRIFSNASDDILSKVDIEKGGFFAPSGSTITIEADFFINSSESMEDLFLIDLECCSCWDPSVSDNQCPGIRLKMGGGKDFLSIERGKILGNTIAHSAFSFPISEWVNVVWKMKLSPDMTGENTLTINGEEVINAAGNNLPNKDEFKDEFEIHGIDFELQEPIGYERIQIGATANPTEHVFEMFIDDFKLLIE